MVGPEGGKDAKNTHKRIDFQRTKFHRAFVQWTEKHSVEIDEDAISILLRKIFPEATIVLELVAGLRRAYVKFDTGAYEDTIVACFPKKFRRQPFVFYHAAWLKTPDDHGPIFCEVFLRLVRDHMGGKAAADLVSAYQMHKVQWGTHVRGRRKEKKSSFMRALRHL
jgi:hypothetical protein